MKNKAITQMLLRVFDLGFCVHLTSKPLEIEEYLGFCFGLVLLLVFWGFFVCLGFFGFFYSKDTFSIFPGLLSAKKVRKERSGGKRKLF